MAIVFISPKKRQKMLLFIIIGVISLILIIIALRVFLIKPKPPLPELVFKPPKIEINFEILESEKVKNLEPFGKIKKEFNYQAKNGEGKEQSGKISAVSEEKALKDLEGLGFSEIKLEMRIGRENPFLLYEITPEETE